MKQENSLHIRTKQLLILLLFIIGCFQSIEVKAIDYKHSFTYSYDNAGNRYQRTYVVTPARLASPALKDSSTLDSLHTLAQKDADTILNNQQEFIKNAIADGDLRVVYPNPTRGNVYIDFTSDLIDTKIEFYDLKGNILSEITINGANLQVDISLFPKGEYIMRIKTSSGKIYTRKVLKL